MRFQDKLHRRHLVSLPPIMLQDMCSHRAVVLGEHEEDRVCRAFLTVRQQIAQLIAEGEGSEHIGLVDMAGHAVPFRL